MSKAVSSTDPPVELFVTDRVAHGEGATAAFLAAAHGLSFNSVNRLVYIAGSPALTH